MPHAKVRTWTLGTLDRDVTYRLWFDPVAYRWEVVADGSDSAEPLRTRDGRGAPADAAERDAGVRPARGRSGAAA
jgi:hypothetical protein